VERVEFNLIRKCLNSRAFEVPESLAKWLHSWNKIKEWRLVLRLYTNNGRKQTHNGHIKCD
jgi:hypothetical protein